MVDFPARTRMLAAVLRPPRLNAAVRLAQPVMGRQGARWLALSLPAARHRRPVRRRRSAPPSCASGIVARMLRTGRGKSTTRHSPTSGDAW